MKVIRKHIALSGWRDWRAVRVLRRRLANYHKTHGDHLRHEGTSGAWSAYVRSLATWPFDPVVVTQDENDPLHQVIGRKPTQSLPWHVNICRQRIREDGAEHSAFSPTGTGGFHEPMKFAHFYDGRSHQFESDPTVTDFLIAWRDATKPRKPEEALTPLLKLTEGKITDYQKAAALEAAAAAACRLKDFAQAEELTARIPIEAVKKTAQMQNLLASQKAAEVVRQFAAEDIAKWPFWKRGDGYFARGRAHAIAGQRTEAERDLAHAVEWISDKRTREAAEAALTKVRNTPR
jgi:hypothetical protein